MSFLQRELNCFSDLLSLHHAMPERYPFLLESISHASQSGAQQRWDILFAFPEQCLELTDNGLKVDGDAIGGNDFLGQLDVFWKQLALPSGQSIDLPFTGGWFLYLGYELASQIEAKLIFKNATCQSESLAMAVRCPAAILRDHKRGRLVIVAEQGHKEYLDIMQKDINELTRNMGDSLAESPQVQIDELKEDTPEVFLKSVNNIKQYIKAGDVFQVNLSRKWTGVVSDNTSAAMLYKVLRKKNPAPFSGLCRFSDWSIISSSPERLVAVDRFRNIQSRPIAGTHPRSQHSPDDIEASNLLLQHPKEKAEHIMLIDLERNDLGRVCRPGTIKVDELMVLESYAHVHHIVSNIKGELRDSVTPGDVIRAVFPGGTITGCPKVRCMEIIIELEQDARGPYTGSMGYLNRDGSLDLNILIRSFSLKNNLLCLRAGAGIVYDSIPTRELAETRAKALGLLLALGKTENEIRKELRWSDDVNQRQNHDTDRCA